jgi:xanthine dehydrogenase molybdopterin-binding subunit B
MRWFHINQGYHHAVQVAVSAADGTVSISCGGTEMGQGLNTKVAQVVAGKLGLSLDMIRVRASNNFINANGSITGGSSGSDMSCVV